MSLTEAMRNALEVSVLKEEEAHDFYAAAALRVKDKTLQELFEQLARDEIGHRDFLRKLLAENAPPMTIKPQPYDYKLAEEIIDEKPDLAIDMPFPQALALAIKREEEAMNTYAELAEEAGPGDMGDLFTNLKNMEQAHKTALEAVYMNVAYAEVW